MSYVPDYANFLIDSGLLFEINRQILHPLGLALQVTIEDNGEASISGLMDCRSDPEGMAFEEETLAEGIRKLDAYMSEHGAKALESRYRALGYRIQGNIHPNPKNVP